MTAHLTADRIEKTGEAWEQHRILMDMCPGKLLSPSKSHLYLETSKIRQPSGNQASNSDPMVLFYI